MWAEPTESIFSANAYFVCKKFKNMYRIYGISNTIIRKEIRQHESDDIRQQVSTYLVHIRKDYFPQTQDFLQPRADRLAQLIDTIVANLDEVI